MTPYVQYLATYIRPECQGAFAYEYRRSAKDPALALFLTILLGFVGGEAYYMGEWKRGILMSLAFMTGIGLVISIPMWIVRCFTITGECEIYNDELAYVLAWRYYDGTQQSVEPPQPQMRQRSNIGGLPMRAN
jgi:hypothetical protein